MVQAIFVGGGALSSEEIVITIISAQQSLKRKIRFAIGIKYESDIARQCWLHWWQAGESCFGISARCHGNPPGGEGGGLACYPGREVVLSAPVCVSVCVGCFPVLGM